MMPYAWFKRMPQGLREFLAVLIIVVVAITLMFVGIMLVVQLDHANSIERMEICHKLDTCKK